MKRATLTVDLDLAAKSGEDRHPQVIIRLFCNKHDLEVADAQWSHRTGTWSFEVQTMESQLPAFPAYIIAKGHK